MTFTRRYLSAYRLRIALFVACTVLAVAFTIATALSVSDFLRLLFDDGGTLGAVEAANPVARGLDRLYRQLVALGTQPALMGFALLLLIVYGLKNLFSYLAALAGATVRLLVVRDVRRDLYEMSLHLPVAYFVSHPKGDIEAHFANDTAEYDENILGATQQLTTAITSIVLYLGMLLYLDTWLTLFSLLTLPLMAFAISAITRQLKRRSEALQEKNARLTARLDETLNGLKIIKAYTAIDFSNARFKADNEDYSRLRTRVQRRIHLASPVSDFLGNAMVIAILLFGSALIFRGTGLQPTLFISYLILFVLTIAPAKDLSTAVAQMKKGRACAERLENFLATPEAAHSAPEAQPFRQLSQGISIRNLWFSYQQTAAPTEDEAWVLRDVTFSLPRGRRVALTGASGSGKSTLADLLLRFYDVQRGCILVDGIPLPDLNLADWRSHIGYVTQDTMLFNGSVRDNIAFGWADATDDEIEKAARLANAHDFIMALPLGYNTPLSDNGDSLSGGQRQRLSIARALVRDPEVLILDEATSALDTESEQAVQQALDQAMQNRTSLIIAHRLSTIAGADHIVVLHDGRIVEQGTHSQLLEAGGHYYRLWSASEQASH